MSESIPSPDDFFPFDPSWLSGVDFYQTATPEVTLHDTSAQVAMSKSVPCPDDLFLFDPSWLNGVDFHQIDTPEVTLREISAQASRQQVWFTQQGTQQRDFTTQQIISQESSGVQYSGNIFPSNSERKTLRITSIGNVGYKRGVSLRLKTFDIEISAQKDMALFASFQSIDNSQSGNIVTVRFSNGTGTVKLRDVWGRDNNTKDTLGGQWKVAVSTSGDFSYSEWTEFELLNKQGEIKREDGKRMVACIEDLCDKRRYEDAIYQLGRQANQFKNCFSRVAQEQIFIDPDQKALLFCTAKFISDFVKPYAELSVSAKAPI